MNLKRLSLILGTLVVAMVGSASAASAAPGEYFMVPCGDGSGFEGREWVREGNTAWNLVQEDCNSPLELTQEVEAYSLFDSATAALSIGPGRLDRLHLHLDGNNGTSRNVFQAIQVCGPDGWPDDCGEPQTVPDVVPPGGLEVNLTSEDFPADSDRIVLSATCRATVCEAGAPLIVTDVFAWLTDSTKPELDVQVPLGWAGPSDTVDVRASDPESTISSFILTRSSGSRTIPVCGGSNVWTCPVSEISSVPLPISMLADGPNNLGVRAVNGAALEKSASVPLKFDAVPPGKPAEIDYGQSSRGWARGLDLVVRWKNPGETVETYTQSGVARAQLVIDSWTGALADAIKRTVTGEDVNTLAVSVPLFGTYTARLTVWDAVGNSNFKEFQINTEPDVVGSPVVSSSLSINAVQSQGGVTFNWGATAPMSGLCGYRVAFDESESTDLSGVDPNRPYTTTANSWTFTRDAIGQFEDGMYYLHIASVACSDAVSPTTSRRVLIDRTPPQVKMEPHPQSGWLTNEGAVTLTLSDNGLTAPTLTYKLDGVPRATQRPVTLLPVGPGKHRLTFSATDGVGNATSEQVIDIGTDSAPPVGSFSRRSFSDPAAVEAVVTDHESGVVDAWIQLVSAEGGKLRLGEPFHATHGTLGGIRLTGRVPDDGSLPDGEYVLQLHAVDASGRSLTSAIFIDGAPSTIRLPLRSASQLSAGLVSASGTGSSPSSRTFAFGARAQLVGVLRQSSGAPIAGAQLTVVAEYADGGARSLGQVVTDGSGSYAHPVGADISRILVIRYAGNQSTGPALARASQSFRSGVKLTSRKVPGGYLLKGRVMTLSASIPDRGVRVAFELCPKRGCTRYGAIKQTDSDGRFTKLWPRPQKRTFIRARVYGGGGWPFSDGASSLVSMGSRSR